MKDMFNVSIYDLQIRSGNAKMPGGLSGFRSGWERICGRYWRIPVHSTDIWLHHQKSFLFLSMVPFSFVVLPCIHPVTVIYLSFQKWWSDDIVLCWFSASSSMDSVSSSPWVRGALAVLVGYWALEGWLSWGVWLLGPAPSFGSCFGVPSQYLLACLLST